MSAPVGMTVDIYGDGLEFGTVTAFNDRGVTVETGTGIYAANLFSGLYARVAALVSA